MLKLLCIFSLEKNNSNIIDIQEEIRTRVVLLDEFIRISDQVELAVNNYYEESNVCNSTSLEEYIKIDLRK